MMVEVMRVNITVLHTGNSKDGDCHTSFATNGGPQDPIKRKTNNTQSQEVDKTIDCQVFSFECEKTHTSTLHHTKHNKEVMVSLFIYLYMDT